MAQDSASDLERRLAQAERQLSEALERQAATDEVLRVIAGSPGELKPVFQAMLGSATRICQAHFGHVMGVTEYQRRFGYRTVLSVPLLREGNAIGVFSLTRDVVEPFSDKQIALAQTFADQAVIAIENVRLFEEI